MKQQYDRVNDDGLEDGTDKKEKGIYRLLNFPSLSTLRTVDYDSQKEGTGSYSTIDEDHRTPRLQRWGPFSIPTGWRFAVYGCIMSCMVSFWINLLLTIIVVAKYGVDGSGRLTLYLGDCNTTKSLNTGLHIFINAMSTIILSSSNYVQQVLCAVTREEVDAAHEGKRRSRWADIGVPSMFNICLIDRRRVLLWYLLMLSSLPLHLFYNSAVFSSTATYAFPIVSVNNQFIEEARSDTSPIANAINATDYAIQNDTIFYGTETTASGTIFHKTLRNGHYPHLVNGSDDYLRSQLNSGAFTELTATECMNAYAQNFVTSRGGLLLVLDVPTNSANNSNATTPIVFDRAASWTGSSWCEVDRFAWICDQTGMNECGESARSYNFATRVYPMATKPCDQQFDALLRDNATNWRPTVDEYPVAKCLSQTLPQQCKLQASIHLMSVVLFLNAAKAVIMYLAVRWMRGVPLLTLGDAIASFLERPDPRTNDMCLITRMEATHEIVWLGEMTDRPRVYNDMRRRWHAGSGKIRQILIVVLLLIAIGVAAFLYSLGILFIGGNGAQTDLASQWAMGIGSVNPATTISFSNKPDSGAAGLVWAAFIANVPQLILSLIYFTYNGILTAYFLGTEWQKFMHERKGLRVSDAPRGAQRSTYFLQLPYRAAIPLMIASGILHWLVSQSIFLVSIETFLWNKNMRWQDGLFPYTRAMQNSFSNSKPNIITCGFSPIPMIFVMIIAVAMIVSLAVLGARKYDASMPVASSNSLAIAAACHLPAEEFEKGDVAFRKVQWGAVEGKNEDGIGHCCFSSLYVEEPKHTQLYA